MLPVPQEAASENCFGSMKFCVRARHHPAQFLASVGQQSQQTLYGVLLGLLGKVIKRKLVEFLRTGQERQEQWLYPPPSLGPPILSLGGTDRPKGSSWQEIKRWLNPSSFTFPHLRGTSMEP